MRHVDTVTARGHGKWGHDTYSVALRTRTTTRWDASGQRREDDQEYFLDCSSPVGSRAFADRATRDAFIAASFSELNITDVEQPEPVEAPHDFDRIAGGFLESVTFVADYVQLHWTAGTMNSYRKPRLEPVAGAPVEPTDPLYAGCLVNLIGEPAHEVDELLEVGLVITLDSARLVVPFDHDGFEIAEFDNHVIA